MSATELLIVGADGEVIGAMVPELAEHLGPRAVEGLARRRLVARGEPCPCGARLIMPNRAERRAARQAGRTTWVRIVHEDGCAATCPELDRCGL